MAIILGIESSCDDTSAAIMVLMVILIAMNSVAIYLRNRFERRW